MTDLKRRPQPTNEGESDEMIMGSELKEGCTELTDECISAKRPVHQP